MQLTDSSNTIFNLAADLVNHTSRPVFITGKAGTGKTTFLKYIREHTQKNMVVVAPTGVAAINAGGATMHAVFQLPFGPFLPVTINRSEGGVEATDKHSLFRNIRFGAAKRELFQELELLVIDEVSMVRCDMLDAVDTILRHFRRQPNLPFGGVQVLYIGDMFQLPPVIAPAEWTILQQHYESPFFFHAKAVQEAPPLYIELKKIYRQNEQRFIDILNNIRNNAAQAADLAELNKRFDSNFRPPAGQKFITLTTHNSKADVINSTALKNLPGAVHSFKAEILGEFSEKALPTEENLQLKEGAQIMFIKNDTGAERRYYNGKLAIVKNILNDEITISFDNGEEDLKLQKETWKNVRYNYNKESDDIEEEELGSFTQFPIRLAWAITIHKSQGLTFEKAVIDAGASFAAGQVYVALSRCTSLEGLVLHSRIGQNAIATDARIIAFAQREANDAELESLLKEEKEKFQGNVLERVFSLQKIVKALQEWREVIPMKKLPSVEEALRLCDELLQKAYDQSVIAAKFQQQIRQLLTAGDADLLHQRVNKAILYFARAVVETILLPLQSHRIALQKASKVKSYYRQLLGIEAIIGNFLEKLNRIQYRDLVFVKYSFQKIETAEEKKTEKRAKAEKGSSGRDTLQLFREGKTVSEIAALRNLAVSTIEGHLAAFVYTGDLPVQDLVEPRKLEAILNAIEGDDNPSSSDIRRKLGGDFSYGQISAVINHQRRLQEKNSSAN